MTPEDFVKWLDGFNSALDGKAPSKAQWEMIMEKAEGCCGANLANIAIPSTLFDPPPRLPLRAGDPYIDTPFGGSLKPYTTC